jgi:hypothetical protein
MGRDRDINEIVSWFHKLAAFKEQNPDVISSSSDEEEDIKDLGASEILDRIRKTVNVEINGDDEETAQIEKILKKVGKYVSYYTPEKPKQPDVPVEPAAVSQQYTGGSEPSDTELQRSPGNLESEPGSGGQV